MLKDMKAYAHLKPGQDGTKRLVEQYGKALLCVRRSLSDLENQSENSTGRGQILSILQVNSCSIDQESGEIWTVQTDLQQIYSKSDSLLAVR